MFTKSARLNTNGLMTFSQIRCHWGGLAASWMPLPPCVKRSLTPGSHPAVIRVYDDAGNVIETHEHADGL